MEQNEEPLMLLPRNKFIELIKMFIKERFSALYPNCSLWEISKSVSSFYVWYKTDSGLRYIEKLSPQEGFYEYKDEGGNYEVTNSERIKKLFLGIDSDILRENGLTISCKDMNYWTCPF